MRLGLVVAVEREGKLKKLRQQKARVLGAINYKRFIHSQSIG
jgi:hypothetical protein